MPLDRLAPDQRAVVQLVLQQGRSYDDLAGLLGISGDAVRDRARAGLSLLAGSAPTPARAGDIVDFLLGQQTVSQREATRELLGSDEEAREWAETVADELDDVAGDELPDIPTGPSTTTALSPEPAAPTVEAPVPVPAEAFDEGDEVDDDFDDLDVPVEPISPSPGIESNRPRPRPLRDGGLDRPRSRPRPGDSPRSPISGPAQGSRKASKLGGMLLIGGLGVLVAAILIFVVGGNDDDDPASTTGNTPSASPSPSASATPQALGQIELKPVGGSGATGALTLFVAPEGGVLFTLQAAKVPALKEGEAYAIWMTAPGVKARRLGYFNEAPQGESRELGTSGPRPEDVQKFTEWLSTYHRVVVSRETVEKSTRPTGIVLSGVLPGAEKGSASATPTP
jgi:hypothetical protein